MSKLSTISFGVVLVAVASSAAYTQSSPSSKGARSASNHNVAMAKAQAACTDGLEFTPLKQASGLNALIVEAPNRQDYDIALNLVATAEQRGAALVLSADINKGSHYAGFHATPKLPANAWRLVVERVRPTGAAASHPSLIRAALFDDKNVEQGRWQGRTIVDSGRTCSDRQKSALWTYLDLPAAHSASYVAGTSEASPVRGKVELKAWAPAERLQGAAPLTPAVSQDCVVSQGAPGAGRRANYHIQYKGKDLEIYDAPYSRGSPKSTAFLCDDQGVVAVGLSGARRFDWDGKAQRSWHYALTDTSPETAITIHDTGEKDARLDIKQPGQEAGYRLTLPDWNTPTTKGLAGAVSAATPYSQCMPAPDLTGLRKLAVNAADPSIYGSLPLGLKNAGKSYVAVLGVKVARDPAPTAVLVDARAGATVVNLAESPNVSYLEVLASSKHPSVLVLDAPPGLVVNVVADSSCSAPLQSAVDAPKLSTVYAGASRERVSLPQAHLEKFGLEAFFANRSEALAALESKSLLQKLSREDVSKIMDDYAATKPIGQRLKAALWDKSALNTDLPHASTFYLVKGPLSLPGAGASHGPNGEVYFVAKGAPAPEGAQGGRVLDLNTYQCIADTFWCPWPGK